MNDITQAQDEQVVFANDVSDEALEAAAFAGTAGVYTQLGLCTTSLDCPG